MDSAIEKALTADVSTTQINPKRGKDNHLSAGLGNIESLKKFASNHELPADANIVEIDPCAISFLEAINHRQQNWLSPDNKEFRKLIKSINQVGQKIPILVRAGSSAGEYELIYGSRRRAACEHLGIHVRAIIVDGVSDADAHELAILENTNHNGLSPLEEARAVAAYKNQNNITDAEVGIVFSRSRSWVSQQYSFANLDPEFVAMVTDPWTITERATRELRTTKNSGYKNKLKKLKKEKKTFAELMKYLNDEQDSSSTLFKDEEGRVIAEVAARSRRNGRSIQRLCIYEGADEKTIHEISSSILEALNQ